jgi:hypothetical protein
MGAQAPGGTYMRKWIEKYDIINNSSSVLSNLALGIAQTHARGVRDTVIFIFGGDIRNAGSTTTNKIQKFNTVTGGAFVISALLSAKKEFLSSAEDDSFVYINGGSHEDTGAVNTYDKFNKQTETITSTPNKFPIQTAFAATMFNSERQYITTGNYLHKQILKMEFATETVSIISTELINDNYGVMGVTIK